MISSIKQVWYSELILEHPLFSFVMPVTERLESLVAYDHQLCMMPSVFMSFQIFKVIVCSTMALFFLEKQNIVSI